MSLEINWVRMDVYWNIYIYIYWILLEDAQKYYSIESIDKFYICYTFFLYINVFDLCVSWFYIDVVMYYE